MASLLKLVIEGATTAEVLKSIEAKADPNVTDAHGKTVLHYAVEKGDNSLVALLLAHGADVNSTDNEGFTPLDVSQVHLPSNPALVQLIRSAGGVGRQDTLATSTSGAPTPVKDVLSVHLDLASEKVGGKALWANDEWFAAAENLFKSGRAIFQFGVFTDRGQLMDGWESARHGALKRGGKDVCLIKLGTPGMVRGFDIDTNHFTGNFASEASVDGLFSTNPDISVNELQESNQWTEILPRTKLSSSAQHFFFAAAIKKCSHIRFNIYPDGGVSRLRIYGDVTPDWSHINLEQAVDLASIKLGGKVVAVSDSFYSHQDNVLMPGRGINMGDGWETRRSRRKNNREWIVIRLARAGTIENIEVDTHHFKGNYPDSCIMEGCFGEGGQWKEFLPRVKLSAHLQHYYSGADVRNIGPITHVRVSIYPDGGISRIRLWGKVANPMTLLKENLLHATGTTIKAIPLTEADFVSYGEVFDGSESSSVQIRDGQKTTWPAQLTTRGDVPPQFFHCRAPTHSTFPLAIDTLEKHPLSSQTIIPASRDAKYLLVLALPSKLGGQPDLLNIAAFVMNGNQSVNIKAGVWFHRILSLDSKEADYLVLSWETPATPHLDVTRASLKGHNFSVAL